MFFVSLYFVIGIIVIGGAVLLAIALGRPPAQLVDLREYKWYETAPTIAEKWNDGSLVGKCDKCRMDDAPIVIDNRMDPSFITGTKCKWCAELDNLNYHLKYNGQRRLRKGGQIPIQLPKVPTGPAPGARASVNTPNEIRAEKYPPKPPGGNGGGSP